MPRDNYRGYRHPFLVGTHYLGGVGDVPRTVTELALCKLSAEIRSTECWWEQYLQSDMRETWARLALERVWRVRVPSGYIDVKLLKHQIDYVLAELSGYAALRDEENNCQVSCFERIWESGDLLDDDNASLLRGELDILRVSHIAGAGRKRTDDGVTHALVDPLSYPLIYGQTLVARPHRSVAPQSPPPATDIYTVSQRFALLPTDIAVATSYDVRFLSYINNLDPAHTRLYDSLAHIIKRLVPLFEHTLTDLHRNNPLSQRIRGACRYTVWDEPDPPEYSDDDEGWATYERDMRHWVMHRPLRLPDVPPAGYSGGLEDRRHRVSLRGRTLQVVISITEQRLEPGGPGFTGTPWHVEGMRNERVVACALYFAVVENVTPFAVHFRMAVTCPRGFSPGDAGAAARTWGLGDGDACHQYVGVTRVRAGRAVVFPNIYQHRLGACALADPMRPGRVTLATVLLVDPDVQPVVSTRTVAPQQVAWVRRAADAALDPRLPVEVVEQIVAGVEGLMDEAEAERVRSEMLAERVNFWKLNNNYHFCIPFDVWNGPDVGI